MLQGRSTLDQTRLAHSPLVCLQCTPLVTVFRTCIHDAKLFPREQQCLYEVYSVCLLFISFLNTRCRVQCQLITKYKVAQLCLWWLWS